MAGECDPEQAIPAAQPWTLLLAFEDRQLLAEREILEDQHLMASRKQPGEAKQTQEGLKHGPWLFLLND